MFLHRPRSNDITASLLKRAKESGYKALVVTLDTMIAGWRPHDLQTSYAPSRYGVAAQIGLSDPVFMARHGKQPVTDHHPEFPYDLAKFEQKAAAGDPEILEKISLVAEWRKEIFVFHDWEHLKFIRDTWEGPLVVKGISSTQVRFVIFFFFPLFPVFQFSEFTSFVQDAEKALTYGVDGIVVSNHGKEINADRSSADFFYLKKKH
jgi:lactate 2-monooxygenase